MPEQANPTLSPEDAEMLAGIAQQTGADPGEILRRALRLYKLVIDEEAREDALARQRAEAIIPTHRELDAIVASGIKPAVWHEGDEPLF
jgi:hypothetical protein